MSATAAPAPVELVQAPPEDDRLAELRRVRARQRATTRRLRLELQCALRTQQRSPAEQHATLHRIERQLETLEGHALVLQQLLSDQLGSRARSRTVSATSAAPPWRAALDETPRRPTDRELVVRIERELERATAHVERAAILLERR